MSSQRNKVLQERARPEAVTFEDTTSDVSVAPISVPPPDLGMPVSAAARGKAVPHAAPQAPPYDGSGQSPQPGPRLEQTWQPTRPPVVDAQPVNVFGEMGDPPVPRPPAAVTGEAGFQQHTYNDEGGDADVAVDPTGKWLAFASTRHSDRPDIYLQRVDGTAVTQLTSDPGDDSYPAFSHDGQQIAFASTRSGSWQVYVMDIDGRNVVQVTNGTMQAIHPSFSPDGTRIVYCAIGSRSNQWELWTANVSTGERRMVGYGLFPVWSPDKTVDRIAYQKSRQRGVRWFSLWTLDLIDGEGRRMTEIAASTNAAIVTPAWSRDGKRLAFATVLPPAKPQAAKPGAKPQDARARDVALRGQHDIWTIDADGSNRQRVTDGNGVNLLPFWAADNRIYFISDRGGMECVWSVRSDSARAVDLARRGGQAKPNSAEAGLEQRDAGQ
jgi:dipeptidyl aminopeptidase/acylaminoacyl peptidase